MLLQLSCVAALHFLTSGVKGASIPGCDCPATSCQNSTKQELGGFLSPLVCFDWAPLFWEKNDTRLDGVNFSNSVCDEEYEEFFTPAFREPYLLNNVGYWYPTGLMVSHYGYGTCDSFVQTETNCSTSLPPLSGTEEDIWYTSGQQMDRKSCSQTSFSFQSGPLSTDFSLFTACRDWFNPDKTTIVYGFDIYISDPEIDLCNTGTPPPPAKILMSSEDWIEPQPNQRYMCKEIEIGKDQPMFFYLTSIGNAPCSGFLLPTDVDVATEAPSKSHVSLPMLTRCVSATVLYTLLANIV